MSNKQRIDFFVYKDVSYGFSTKVIFSDEFIEEQALQGKRVYKYGSYSFSYIENGKIYSSFIKDTTEIDKKRKVNYIEYCQENKYLVENFDYSVEVPDYIIADYVFDKITQPYVYNVKLKEPKKHSELLHIYILEIIAMLGVLVLRGGILLQPLIFIFFTKWLEEERWK